MLIRLSDPQSRAARTLEKIVRGTLPASVHGRVWVGPGSGNVCSGCGDSINPTEREFERDPSNTFSLSFHAECYDAWLNTRASADEDPAASGGAG